MRRFVLVWCLLRFTCTDYCALVQARRYLDALSVQEANSAHLVPLEGASYAVIYRSVRACKELPPPARR